MSVNKPVLCIAVMLLLLFGAASTKRRCDFSMILATYRTLTLVELRSLNLAGPFDTSKEKDRCPSNKAPHILRSIYGMIRLFECISEGQNEDSLTGIVERMSLLIRRNCRKKQLANGRKSCKKGLQQKEISRRRLKLIKMLVNCWQKLQSVSV